MTLKNLLGTALTILALHGPFCILICGGSSSGTLLCSAVTLLESVIPVWVMPLTWLPPELCSVLEGCPWPWLWRSSPGHSLHHLSYSLLFISIFPGVLILAFPGNVRHNCLVEEYGGYHWVVCFFLWLKTSRKDNLLMLELFLTYA